MSNNRWRTVDIVVAAVIGVAFGVVFWAWGLLWNGPADAIPLPARSAALRRLAAAGRARRAGHPQAGRGAVSPRRSPRWSRSLLGTSWGWTLVLQGPLEGLGAELVFALFATGSTSCRWRCWPAPLAGWSAALFDVVFWYPGHVAGRASGSRTR